MAYAVTALRSDGILHVIIASSDVSIYKMARCAGTIASCKLAVQRLSMLIGPIISIPDRNRTYHRTTVPHVLSFLARLTNRSSISLSGYAYGGAAGNRTRVQSV